VHVCKPGLLQSEIKRRVFLGGAQVLEAGLGRDNPADRANPPPHSLAQAVLRQESLHVDALKGDALADGAYPICANLSEQSGFAAEYLNG
jgi:hypothetical protein